MINEELVKKAVTDAFVNRDPSAIDKYGRKYCKQKCNVHIKFITKGSHLCSCS